MFSHLLTLRITHTHTHTFTSRMDLVFKINLIEINVNKLRAGIFFNQLIIYALWFGEAGRQALLNAYVHWVWSNVIYAYRDTSFFSESFTVVVVVGVVLQTEYQNRCIAFWHIGGDDGGGGSIKYIIMHKLFLHTLTRALY